ncbi:hypothetical protein PG985_003687 [Apiospora marii]|uniref:Uncharacterized protein n=1 Tax=Apiospora marii TaxID=335849 RepID=A0ABR1SJP6_9PEZI
METRQIIRPGNHLLPVIPILPPTFGIQLITELPALLGQTFPFYPKPQYGQEESQGDDAQQHDRHNSGRIVPADGRPLLLMLLFPVPPVPHGRRHLTLPPRRIAGRPAPDGHGDVHPGRRDPVGARPEGGYRGRRRETGPVVHAGAGRRGPRAAPRVGVLEPRARREVHRVQAQDLGRGGRRDGGDAAGHGVHVDAGVAVSGCCVCAGRVAATGERKGRVAGGGSRLVAEFRVFLRYLTIPGRFLT